MTVDSVCFGTWLLGGTLGVAVIGSVYASLYASRLTSALPTGLPGSIARTAHDDAPETRALGWPATAAAHS